MANTALVQARVEPKTKKEAEKVFARLGLDLPTAIRMFLAKTSQEQDIPFCLHDHTVHSIETLEAAKEAREIAKHPEKHKAYDTFAELLADVDNKG